MGADEHLGCDCPGCSQGPAMLALFGLGTLAAAAVALVRWLT